MSTGAATWHGKAVSIGQLESELQRLWRAADSDWDGQGRRPDIRTSVLNLIVYARDSSCADRATSAIEHLSGTHPSRSIIISAGDLHGEASIDARLSIKSHGAYAEFRQVCSEELALTVNGPASRHLHSVIIPLLAPDLPVFIWWPGEAPFQHHVFQQLRELADHFIVDSSDFANPEQDLVTLAHAARSGTSIFADFNWGRTAPWRDAVAAFFDAAEFRPLLKCLRSVQINGLARNDQNALDLPQALLVAGWLCSSLDLRAGAAERAETGLTLHASSEESAVDLKLGLAPRAGADVTLRLFAEPPGQAAVEFHVSMDRHNGQLTSEILGAGDRPAHHSSAPDRDEASLLFQELETFERDALYDRSLQMASSLIDSRYQTSQIRGSLLA
ncbi:MAG: glucose-6-phosphate dehydrogenase assembly protein OpcA [Chloroflexi bacterium]|nr:glucose-6-phosphate dehydrogenase assembly protein OpcA [Chloroflexota bacterium]